MESNRQAPHTHSCKQCTITTVPPHSTVSFTLMIQYMTNCQGPSKCDGVISHRNYASLRPLCPKFICLLSHFLQPAPIVCPWAGKPYYTLAPASYTEPTHMPFFWLQYAHHCNYSSHDHGHTQHPLPPPPPHSAKSVTAPMSEPWRGGPPPS
jgi:hypothetical protein